MQQGGNRDGLKSAKPRDSFVKRVICRIENNKAPGIPPQGFLSGGYLLSHLRSTIGAVRFNFSVRNGKRWSPDTITTLIV